MKVYISIPISSRPVHEAKYHAEVIKAKLEHHDHECITPFDVCPEADKSYAYYMGRDIEVILAEDVDAVVFGRGFEDSLGCNLEHAAAMIYGKVRVYESCFYMLDFDTLRTITSAKGNCNSE